MWEYEPSHWPCLEISLARMKLSFCNGSLWGNPSKTFPCLIINSEYTMPFQISWPNCASSYTARHLESQKEILFRFTVIQITPLFCFIKKKKCQWKGEECIPSSRGYNRSWWKCRPIYKWNNLANIKGKDCSVLISSALWYVVQRLRETFEQGNNVTPKHWNSSVLRYTCLWA